MSCAPARRLLPPSTSFPWESQNARAPDRSWCHSLLCLRCATTPWLRGRTMSARDAGVDAVPPVPIPDPVAAPWRWRLSAMVVLNAERTEGFSANGQRIPNLGLSPLGGPVAVDLPFRPGDTHRQDCQ